MDALTDLLTYIGSAGLIAITGYFAKLNKQVAIMEEKIHKLETNDIKQDDKYATIIAALSNIQVQLVKLETKQEVMEVSHDCNN